MNRRKRLVAAAALAATTALAAAGSAQADPLEAASSPVAILAAEDHTDVASPVLTAPGPPGRGGAASPVASFEFEDLVSPRSQPGPPN